MHPDNREGAGLVPIDVHDLLLRIVNDGFSYTMVNLLGSTVPTTAEGQRWRDFNEMLANGSGGLPPQFKASFMEAVTVRGSHTTSAVRIVKLGAKGVHEKLCLDGVVSQSKIVEKRPSGAEQLKRGLPYTIIKWQLVVECPKLMSFLSRTGNVSHGVHRVATALQGCMSVFNAFTKEGNWDMARKAACLGQPPEFEESVGAYVAFVRTQSGGADGKYLKSLEQYERSLGVKRQIHAHDLQRLAAIDMPDAPRYVLAMTKALLNAPSSKVTNGFADLFGQSDLSSLGPNGKNRKLAAQASELMVAASSFLEAYCQLDMTSVTKIVSDLEVRAVMHVHQIKVDTRAKYKSLLHIGLALWQEAKAADINLPAWPKIRSLQDAPTDAPTSAASSRGIRELCEDGKLPNAELISHGFVIGALVREGDATYTLASMDDDKTVLLKPTAADTSDMNVSRVDLLKTWKVHKEDEEEAYTQSMFKKPSEKDDFQSTMWKGIAKAAIASVYDASSEADVKVVRKPEQKVVALKDFAVGKLQLTALTPNINTQIKRSSYKESDTAVDMGVAYKSDDGDVHLFAKQCLIFPKNITIKDTSLKAGDEFIAAYWATKQTYDARLVNVVKDMKSISVKIGSLSSTINVPIFTNSVRLKCGDEIVVLKGAKDDEDVEEPVQKRRKTEVSTGSKTGSKGGKSNSHGKGKAR